MADEVDSEVFEWAEALQRVRSQEDQEALLARIEARVAAHEAKAAREAAEAFIAIEAAYGKKIREWRRGRQWSQEDLARRMTELGFEMHQTTVAKIETGTRPLRVAEAAVVAHIFGVNPLTVFYSAAEPTESWAREAMQRAMIDHEKSIADANERLQNAAKDVAFWEHQRATTAWQLKIAAEVVEQEEAGSDEADS